MAQPLTPPALNILWQGSNLLLDWEPVAGAASYRVESTTGLQGSWSPLGTVTVSELVLDAGSVIDTRLYRVICLQP